MKLGDLTVDIAKRVMSLWQEHLGFWYKNNRYLEHPELLVSSLQDPTCWTTGRFEDRIGSMYTDDSKLLAYLRSEGLEFECYVQTHTVFGQDRKQEAERAEEAFNRAVMEYVKTVK
jgi:hypothetical protein